MNIYYLHINYFCFLNSDFANTWDCTTFENVQYSWFSSDDWTGKHPEKSVLSEAEQSSTD